MILKAIRFLYYSLFFLTPLLMFPTTSELFEFNKMLFIYAIAITVAALWIVKMILEKRFIGRATPLDIPILLFVISQLLSTLFSIDRQTSLFGYYGRFNAGFLSILSYVLLFYGLVTFFEKEHRDRLLKYSVIASVITILWGLPGRFGRDLSCFLFTGELSNSCWTEQFRPDVRMFSTLGQPNWFGAYMAVHFFIGIYFLIKRVLSSAANSFKTMLFDKNTVLLIVYILAVFMSIQFSLSRSALLGTFAGCILLDILLVIRFRKSKEKLFSLLKIGGVAAAGILTLLLVFKTGIGPVDKVLSLQFITISQRVVPVSAPKPSAPPTSPLDTGISESGDIRDIVWKGAWDLGRKYPVLGSGVETFAYAYYFVRPVAHNLTSEWDYLYNKAHNEYLNYFATTGFLGIGTYAILIISTGLLLLAKIFKKDSNDGNSKLLAICLFSSYAAILISNYYGFSTTTIQLFFYLIPGFLLLRPRDELSASQSEKTAQISRGQTIALLGTGAIYLYLTVLLAFYFVADRNYALGTNYSRANDFPAAATYLDRALKLRYEHVYQDKYANVLANLAFIASYQKQDAYAKQLITLANNYNVEALRASSKNVLYWKTRAKNAYLFYQIDFNPQHLREAIGALEKAQDVSPTDPKIPYTLSVMLGLLADEEKDEAKQEALHTRALFEADRAISLKPNYKDSYLLKAQLLKKTGKQKEARQVYQYILDKIDPKDPEALKELDVK